MSRWQRATLALVIVVGCGLLLPYVHGLTRVLTFGAGMLAMAALLFWSGPGRGNGPGI